MTFIAHVVDADGAIRELKNDPRRSIYECSDGTYAIDHQGGVIGRDVIDELERSGRIKRRWENQPELNCWVLTVNS